jgi:hexosaminidase
VNLLPAPRELDLIPGGPGADVPVRTARVTGLPAEGYEIVLTSDEVRIDHADDAGLRYARRTLDGLADPHTGRLPSGRVRDWPDFPIRGFMLDVSRDRVPTRETLEWLVELLAAVRVNHLELYMEHTFAYPSHEVVWRDASPLTPDDVEWLDALTAARGIELAPNQNCFGHFDRWLKHPEYRDRAEAPDGWTMPLLGTVAPAGTLEPTPANAAFALALVRELTTHFASRRVNIGCDETFELGMGRSAGRVADAGKADVFVEHLRRIIGPLVAEGHEVWFWGDMVRRRGDLLATLPAADCRALVWNYEAPAGTGGEGFADLLAQIPDLAEVFEMPDDAHLGFRSHARAFAEAGFPFLLAPGTSSWNTLIGRWSNARANLLDAVDTGQTLGAGGILVTDWGDNGHLQPPIISVPGIVFGGAVAWCADANRDLDVAAHVDRLIGDDSGRLGATLLALGDCYLRTGRRTVNGSPLFMALFQDPPLPLWGDADPDGVRDVDAVLEEAADVARTLTLTGAQAAAVAGELGAAVGLARHGLRRIARGAGLPAPDDAGMLADLDAAVAAQRDAWLARCRPGGLDDSLARLAPTRRAYAESNKG